MNTFSGYEKSNIQPDFNLKSSLIHIIAGILTHPRPSAFPLVK